MNSCEYRPSRVKNPAPNTKLVIGLTDGDAGCVDGGGQTTRNAGHAVLYVDSRDIQVVAGLKVAVIWLVPLLVLEERM